MSLIVESVMPSLSGLQRLAPWSTSASRLRANVAGRFWGDIFSELFNELFLWRLYR